MKIDKEKFILNENLNKKLCERKLTVDDFVDGDHLKNNKEVIKFYFSLIRGYFVVDDHDWSQKPEDEEKIIGLFNHLKDCKECQKIIMRNNLKSGFEKISQLI
jgi:predicted MPP superfamily phosphohydrolase